MVTPDVLEAYTELTTSNVSDAMDKLRIAGQCVGLRPLDHSFRLVGTAFTVRYVPVGPDADGSVGDFVDDLNPGQVPVLDNAGRLDATVWGDLLTTTAQRRGLPGTVIDGVCRDIDCSLQLGYPIFSRGSWMRTGKGRVKVDAYQVPVSIGGVLVEPGDLLVGDFDGIVAIPAARAADVLDAATALRRQEDRIRAEIQAGSTLAEGRRKHGYHHLQSPTS